MKTVVQPKICPICKSDDWIKTHKKDKNGQRCMYKAAVCYCRDCRNDFEVEELEFPPNKYSIYGGYI
jgi:transposase-like protein